MLPKPVLVDDRAVQPVTAPVLKQGTVIDASSSRIGVFHGSRLEDLVLEDLKFVHVEIVDFVNDKFPLGLFGTVKQHATALTVAAMASVAFVGATKIGPVQITIAVAFMSLIVGVLNAVPGASIMALFKNIISR
jgi:hypothetical protein